MSDNTPLLTVVKLLEELKEVDNWYMLGAYLSVPLHELNKIQSTYKHEGVDRCKLQMLQYWLNNSIKASWRDVARALEHLNMVTLAEKLKSKYLRTSPATTPDGSFSSTQSSDIDPSYTVKTIKENEVKKEEILRATTTKEFQQAEVSRLSRAETPREDSAILLKKQKLYDQKEAEAVIAELRIKLRTAEECLHTTDRVSRVELGKKAFATTFIILTIAAAICYYCSYVEQKELQTVDKLLVPQETEMRRRVGDLEEFVLSHFPSYLHVVQVTGEGKELATTGKETCFELNLSSLPFPVNQFSCQLIDSHHQHIHCSIMCTSSQKGVCTHCTVKYTPTLHGLHQLRITIRDYDIPGSPFTIRVLPSPEMRGVVQHTITDVEAPYGVAVSDSGEVVVSEYDSHCISVYSMDGKKIRSFGSEGSNTGQFQYPRGVAITSDNHILVADEGNYRIQMFTMDGRFVQSVGQKGQQPLQFQNPSGIAVHPSGRVFVADIFNHCIQVINPDLSFSHMFGSKGSGLGQFNHPRDVAINSGVVYVTDTDNHRVQLFFADGQFISSFGSEDSQHGQLLFPTGICVDSTNTVYVTDKNHHVSVYNSSGQFIKSFSTRGSEEGELSFPKGVAVDDSTGALYVCDYSNDRVVVY